MEVLIPMIKYIDYAVVLSEVPDEISVAIEITNCPHKCENCHSPHLRNDIGTELTDAEIDAIIKKSKGITCVCLMGGDASHKDVANICKYVHNNYPSISVAMYSGDDVIDDILVRCLDYYKVGSYQEKYGPINKNTTNQRFYSIKNGKMIDETYKFWKENW